MSIRFFHPDEEYGFLSNFSAHGFDLEDRYWPTVEHYYQAQKFLDSELRERILETNSPKRAKRLGWSFADQVRLGVACWLVALGRGVQPLAVHLREWYKEIDSITCRFVVEKEVGSATTGSMCTGDHPG